MALFHSQVLTAASGSVGGVTYSRAPSGMYMRARAVPVNPNTALQITVRAALTSLVNFWLANLTDAQRNAWDLYAANVPTTNRLGAALTLSGQNWYVANNVPRLQSDAKLATTLATIDNAPTDFNRGEFTTPTATSDVSTGTTITFTAGDAWNTAGGAMFVYQGRPRNLSRNQFKGPWRLIATISGSTPGVSPLVITPAEIASRGYTYSSSQRIRYAFAVSQPDGRLSTRREVDTVSVP